MVVNRSPKSKKPLPRWLPVVAGLGVVCAVLVVLELTHVTNFIHRTPAPTGPGPTPAQKIEQAKTFASDKQQAIENPVKTTPSPAPSNSALSLSAHQESNGTVTVFTNLGAIADGSCTLDVSNGTAKTSLTADVIYQPQYSTCAGFSVPVASVGSGNWTLTLSVTSSGVTATKTLQTEVQ